MPEKLTLYSVATVAIRHGLISESDLRVDTHVVWADSEHTAEAFALVRCLADAPRDEGWDNHHAYAKPFDPDTVPNAEELCPNP